MADNKNYVKTPKGKIVGVRHKDGTMTMKLEWNEGFSSKMNRQFGNAQEFVDSECIRLMRPYTPMRNGILVKSASLGTDIGSGEIHQVAPYARYLYYGKVYGPNIPIFEKDGETIFGISPENGQLVGFFSPKGMKKYPTGADIKYSTSKHQRAGKMWFERMKADHKDAILRGAAKYAGGNAKK